LELKELLTIMELKEAEKINALCCKVFFASQGLGKVTADQLNELLKLSLFQMIIAMKIIKKHERVIKKENGLESKQVSLTCDERLIAALYTYLNYDAQENDGRPEPVIALGKTALFLIRMN
jgi:hypothetical protein